MKVSQKLAIGDNRGTAPLTLTLSPEAGERGLILLPLPVGPGWGEGAFPHIAALSCYDYPYASSFETVSDARPTGPWGQMPSHRGENTSSSMCNSELSTLLDGLRHFSAELHTLAKTLMIGHVL